MSRMSFYYEKKKELDSKRKKNAKTLISFIQRNLFHV